MKGRLTVGVREVSPHDSLDFVESLGNELRALQQRWENGITGEDLRRIGEGYARGRLSLVREFQTTAGIVVADSVKDAPRTDDERHAVKTYVVHLVNQRNLLQLGDCKARDDEIVLVDVVGLADFPEGKVPLPYTAL